MSGNLKEFGYFGSYAGYYNAVRKELPDIGPDRIKEEVFNRVKETVDNVVLPNGFNFVIFVEGGQGGKGRFAYPSQYLDSMVSESEDAFGPVVDYCHKNGLRVFLHDLDDNNIGEFGIPVCYELARRYNVDGFSIERPPLFMGEYLKSINPDLELQAFVCSEKYDKPWVNWSMENILERRRMYSRNTVFYMLYCYGGGLITPERCEELMIEAVENPEINGVMSYFGDSVEMRERIRIIGDVLRERKITPEKKLVMENVRINKDLPDLIKDRFYMVEIEVGEGSAIHSPVWFLNPEGEKIRRADLSPEDRVHSPVWTGAKSGRWEWMGTIIFPRFTFEKPRWRTYFPVEYVNDGILKIKIGPPTIDPGRGDPRKIKGYRKTNNYYVDQCVIKRVTVMTPPVPDIEKKILGSMEYDNGIEVKAGVSTVVSVAVNA